MNNRLHLSLWIAFILVPLLVFMNTKNFETAFLTFTVELFLYGIYGLFYLRWILKRQDDSEIWIIDNMTDEQLEGFTSNLLIKLGYSVTKPVEANSAISFLLTSSTCKIVIAKVKSHKKQIGIRLVEKVFKQMSDYDASECWVLTNRGYTPQAREFAKTNTIFLYDREKFIKWILKAKKDKVF